MALRFSWRQATMQASTLVACSRGGIRGVSTTTTFMFATFLSKQRRCLQTLAGPHSTFLLHPCVRIDLAGDSGAPNETLIPPSVDRSRAAQKHV